VVCATRKPEAKNQAPKTANTRTERMAELVIAKARRLAGADNQKASQS
jgi:hypothetical protein